MIASYTHNFGLVIDVVVVVIVHVVVVIVVVDPTDLPLKFG